MYEGLSGGKVKGVCTLHASHGLYQHNTIHYCTWHISFLLKHHLNSLNKDQQTQKYY
jgi:hypothetical protein